MGRRNAVDKMHQDFRVELGLRGREAGDFEARDGCVESAKMSEVAQE